MYKFIVLGDTHIGDPRFRCEDQFLELLDSLGPSYHLVLNGDIFDSWVVSEGEILVQYEDLINKLRALGNRVTWLLGNHDPSLEVAREILPDAIIADHGTWNIIDDIVIFHGDQVHGKKNWWINRVLARVNAFIYSLTNQKLDLQRFFLTLLGFYKRHMRKKTRKYIDSVKDNLPENAILIMNHIHIRDMMVYRDFNIYNLGVSIDKIRYAEITDGKLYIRTWHHYEPSRYN